MMQDFVKIAEFAVEIGKTEVTVRQMAQHGKVEAEKRGKTWYIDRSGERAQGLIEKARREEAKRAENARKALEPYRLGQEVERLRAVAEEKQERIGALEEALEQARQEAEEWRRKAEKSEAGRRLAEAREGAWREALKVLAGGPSMGRKEEKQEHEVAEAFSLAEKWAEYRAEAGSSARYEAFAEAQGVSVSEVRRAVRRARDQRRKALEK